MLIEFEKWSDEDEYGIRESVGCRLMSEAETVRWLDRYGGALETLDGVYFDDDNIHGLIALFADAK